MLKTKCKSYYFPILKDYCQEQNIPYQASELGFEFEIVVECPEHLEAIVNKIKRLEFLNENY